MKKKPMHVMTAYDYDRIGSFRNGNPYAIAFCYCSKTFNKHGEFVIKGGARDVERKLDSLDFPLLVFMSYWRHGRSRFCYPSLKNFKRFSAAESKPYWSPTDYRRDYKQWRSFYRKWVLKFCGKTILSVRRVPKKWIPEYDEMLTHTHRRLL